MVMVIGACWSALRISLSHWQGVQYVIIRPLFVYGTAVSAGLRLRSFKTAPRRQYGYARFTAGMVSTSALKAILHARCGYVDQMFARSDLGNKGGYCQSIYQTHKLWL
jgi:hypothetical protein